MIEIYTDGSSRGNPGPGGYGIVMIYKDKRKELFQGYKLTTNNRMELLAVIRALEEVKTNKHKIKIYSDSKYVVESVEKGWIWNWQKKSFKNKQNVDLWKMFIPLYKKYDVKLIWVKGHDGNTENERCDFLANSCQENTLIVFDNISKFYAVNLKNGDLLWSKKNKNPINSQIKILDDKIYSVDMNNIIRCVSLLDGSEVWKFKSENIFLKSPKRNSIIVKNNRVYLNNSIGDIIAINAQNGSLLWQTPTQSSLIYENAFDLIISDLIANQDNLVFSNNRNELYSLNLNNGLINWKQDVNSSVRSIFYNNLIFSISNEGYFFIIDSKSGNIIRITDVFNIFKNKNREKIRPIGFIASYNKLMLSTNNGKLLKIDIASGKTESVFKIDKEKISRPFVFIKKILLVKNNSIIRLN